ncbi:MAG: ankyrin repeat domain-containing protein [Micavibrio sp.]|nr:ankyrin repeat domain-containing protein [Micavibrio sp.]
MFGLSRKEKDRVLLSALSESYDRSADAVIEALRKGADPNVATQRHGSALIASVAIYTESAALRATRALLTAGAEVNFATDAGWTALHTAAKRTPEAPDMIELLLKAGAETHAEANNGETPLMTALRHKLWNIAKMLVEAELPPQLSNRKTGETALTVAVANEAPVSLIKTLLSYDPGINAAPGKDRKTALHLVAERRQLDTLTQLLAVNDLHINAVNSNGSTALHLAVETGNNGGARMLIEHGVDINIQDRRGVTPLNGAAKLNVPDLVETLVTAGAALDKADTAGNTPLQHAARHGSIRAVKAILAAAEHGGLDLAQPLRIAAEHGQGRVLELLLEAGADVNAVDKSGYSALMNAAQGGFAECLEILLKAGADTQLVDAHKMQAYDHAVSAGKPAAKDILARYRTDAQLAPEAASRDYGFTRLNDHSLEVREGGGLSMTFNFWTQQVIIRDLERAAPVTIQNFNDLQRQEAVDEAFARLKQLGGNPPDPRRASLNGKPAPQLRTGG